MAVTSEAYKSYSQNSKQWGFIHTDILLVHENKEKQLLVHWHMAVLSANLLLLYVKS